MNWFTATVAMRPLAMRAGSTAPARSTWAMIQPPKMSPLPLASAGIGITRSTSWRSSGRRSAAPDARAMVASASTLAAFPSGGAGGFENSGILRHFP